MVSTINVICECGDPECKLSVRLSVDLVQEITTVAGATVIIDECVTGPKATDTLSSEGDGYTVYIRNQTEKEFDGNNRSILRM